MLHRIIEIQTPTLLEYTEIKLSQFCGIELDDFAHEMAILSLWLAEHQMNKIFEEQLAGYGESKPILPLKEAGHIVQGNSCRKDWKEVCPIGKDDEVYIIGNPPYLGARLQDIEQKKDMSIVFKTIRGYNNMDYIACWFYMSKEYISGFNAKTAFVSTNSICQGEQVALLWPHILSDSVEIDFAHHSFKWTNNAKGNAGVTVIILGLRNISKSPKYLFDSNIKRLAKNISPYLMDTENTIIIGRSSAISNMPEMSFGSMPNDGGFLILDDAEYAKFISEYPECEIFIRKFAGGCEFLKDIKRYCFWINSEQVELSQKNQIIRERLISVKQHRQNSSRQATIELSDKYYAFGEIRHQESDSIIIPATSSEKRNYIPIGFLSRETIISNSAMAIYDAKPWHFAVITSRMHMAWMRAVGGRLKTDYRYSAKLCYNTFPFPNITEKQKENLNLYVFSILDERAKHPEKTMAQLYNPDTMPAGLKKAHQELDEAIERCYRLQPFTNDTERLEYLFRLYEDMTTRETLFAKPTKRRTKK